MKNDQILACLPYLKVSTQQLISMGPVSLCAGHCVDTLVNADAAMWATNYLNDLALTPESVTCIAVSSEIPEEKRAELLVDALHLLYFVLSYKAIYYNLPLPDAWSVTQVIPMTETLIHHAEMERILIEKIHTTSFYEEESQKQLLEALGHLLSKAYDPQSEECDQCRAFVRSIRFFISGLWGNVNSLMHQGDPLKSQIFEPERNLFLMTAFYTLLDLKQHQMKADFKQQLRKLLHMKFSKPVEMLWYWVDGFCALHERQLYAKQDLSSIFDANQYLQIPYIDMGKKIFIYVVFRKLHEADLIVPLESSADEAIRYPIVLPEEILSFFWEETRLIQKIALLMGHVQGGKISDELISDLRTLTKIYSHISERYHEKPIPEPLIYRSPPPEEIRKPAKAVLEMAEQNIVLHDLTMPLSEILPSAFVPFLQDSIAA